MLEFYGASGLRKKMAYPASHFMITYSEFATIYYFNPNQPTLTRMDLKETINIHTCKIPMHMAHNRPSEIRYH